MDYGVSVLLVLLLRRLGVGKVDGGRAGWFGSEERDGACSDGACEAVELGTLEGENVDVDMEWEIGR